ncbi:MAG: hypothetical protein GTO45_36020 [Candidatus Aminicenantes bacterium]|nr:hypothetical protein [Candidatus Aminicenantes bacterium]NIM84110.1 hypothetical protein [Candidatus Aminicenantes bacterium]NIN17247.1 hypothetical protein [Candidatus Aminicenantes bacterium]NIN47265.1 hypothetical protein [Candidatus Aminicenantes bacterium]NIN90192.1 hypothetical protein [Candidatus Aminicenantes bacterium]
MRVYGTIEDARSERPLSGANVTVSIGDTVLIENTPSIDGHFNFEFEDSLLSDESDILTCTIEKEGYRSQTLSHKIVDESAQFDVELIPMRVVKWPRILFIAGIILAVLIISLGIYFLFFGEGKPGPPPPPPVLEIKDFTANPDHVAAGQTVVLQWEVFNATDVYLGDKKVEPKKKIEVKPEETTVYTLVAKGKKDKELTKEIKVVVPPLPEIISFKAAPPVITQWDLSLLEWETANAKLVYISDGAGEERPPGKPPETGKEGIEGKITEQSELSGTAVVSPLETTTYTLVVENSVGVKVKKSIKVKVILPPEIISFTASEQTIKKDSTVLLAWRTANAEQVFLKEEKIVVSDSKEGEETVKTERVVVNEERIGPNFSKEVAPHETTTFVLVAKNQVGERQRRITINVPTPPGEEPKEKPGEPRVPPPPPKINRFLTTPPEIAAGQTSILEWVTEHAAAIYLNQERVKPVGSKKVFPQQTSEYQLKVINESGEASWTRTVEVRSARCTVILYELENYLGDVEEFTFDSPGIVELDNKVSSLKIIGDCAVRVYSAPKYKGIHQVFTQSVPRLRGTLMGNNNISSLKLVDKYEVNSRK